MILPCLLRSFAIFPVRLLDVVVLVGEGISPQPSSLQPFLFLWLLVFRVSSSQLRPAGNLEQSGRFSPSDRILTSIVEINFCLWLTIFCDSLRRWGLKIKLPLLYRYFFKIRLSNSFSRLIFKSHSARQPYVLLKKVTAQKSCHFSEVIMFLRNNRRMR